LAGDLQVKTIDNTHQHLNALAFDVYLFDPVCGFLGNGASSYGAYMVHWCTHKSALRSVGKPQGSVDVIEELW
jgi:peptidoglycan/LPS O-acetylase OafA/YrhL